VESIKLDVCPRSTDVQIAEALKSGNAGCSAVQRSVSDRKEFAMETRSWFSVRELPSTIGAQTHRSNHLADPVRASW
jgi:hypothetical protein